MMPAVGRAASRIENRLVVTGQEAAVEAFKTECCSAASPASLSFLPRGVAWDNSTQQQDPAALTFQRMLPVAPSESLGPAAMMARWGSATDAQASQLLAGPPRAHGRTSIVYEFLTEGHAPLAWLEEAAAAQPALRLGLKWAEPDAKAAFEAVYQQGRLIVPKAQVSFNAWVFDYKVDKRDLFSEIKGLLAFPDGRVPKKRRPKTALDVEKRLRKAGAYTQAVMLLAYHGIGGAVGAEHAAWGLEDVPRGSVRLFQKVVLPDFVAWLNSEEGLALA